MGKFNSNENDQRQDNDNNYHQDQDRYNKINKRGKSWEG